MNLKKALTDITRMLILLALASAGAFSLFTSCTMREVNITNTETEMKSDEPVILTDIPDSTVPPTAPRDFPERENFLPAADSVEWSVLFEKSHGAGSASEIIMTPDEIEDFNRAVIEKCPTVLDMKTLPESFSGERISEMLDTYTVPSGYFYDKSGRAITADEVRSISANINRGAVKDTIPPKTAVVVERCSLKSIPTELDFFAYGDTYYSQIQETELIAGFPVQILHESADGEFLFVQSYYYYGWIPSSAAAVCTEEEYRIFASPEKYVTVIQPYIEIAGNRFDMGAVIPYVSENDTTFNVLIPVRMEDGTLALTEAETEIENAVFGRLPYTAELFFSQAFKYLGTEYGWGGSDGGVDCSSFVCSVFRSFGIYLPRNTGEQRLYSGSVINLAGMTRNEMLDEFRKLKYPAAVHRPGHVMLFLGMKNDMPYIIHAPQGGEKVSVTELSYIENLLSFAEISPLTGISSPENNTK